MTKMQNSSLEDNGVVLEEISKIQSNSDILKLKLSLIETQANALIEERDYYKSISRNSYIFGNVLAPLPGLTLAAIGGIEMFSNNFDRGWEYLKAGAVAIVSIEVVYQGGHFLFKKW